MALELSFVFKSSPYSLHMGYKYHKEVQGCSRVVFIMVFLPLKFFSVNLANVHVFLCDVSFADFKTY